MTGVDPGVIGVSRHPYKHIGEVPILSLIKRFILVLHYPYVRTHLPIKGLHSLNSSDKHD